jgi:hypothetical protein
LWKAYVKNLVESERAVVGNEHVIKMLWKRRFNSNTLCKSH